MNRAKCLLLAISLLFPASAAFAACEGSLPQGHADEIDTENLNIDAFTDSVRYYSNIIRCERGLKPFEQDNGLLNAVIVQSEYMAKNRQLSHKSNISGYRNLRERLKTSGVSMRTAGENIGQNYLYVLSGKSISLSAQGKCRFTYTDTGQIVPKHTYASLAKTFVESWSKSPSHMKNLTNRKFTRMEASIGYTSEETTCGWIYSAQNFAG